MAVKSTKLRMQETEKIVVQWFNATLL